MPHAILPLYAEDPTSYGLDFMKALVTGANRLVGVQCGGLVGVCCTVRVTTDPLGRTQASVCISMHEFPYVRFKVCVCMCGAS